jgi:serine phosphatase RsbU (regulator of sigma subunit)
MPQIVVIGGPGTGQTFALTENQQAVLGSTPGLTIHLPSQAIGTRQAELVRTNGRTTLTNLDRAIPLLVNGDAIDSPRLLAHGDMVMVGDVMLLYDEEVAIDDEPALPAAPEALPPIADPTIHHRQKFFDDAELLMRSLQQTSDPSRYLGSFLKVTNALVENIDLDVLLPRILEIVFEVIPADRGTVLLLVGDDLVPAASLVRGQTGRQPRVEASRTIASQVMQMKEGVLTRDAMADDRFSTGMSIVEQRIHAVLCVPLIRHTGEVLGVIHLDTTSSGRTFHADHLKLLTGIAMEATLAIVNARLVSEVGEKKRIERELEIASSIQMNLVPREAPKVPGLTLAGLMRPAKEVGGDYYDFVSSKNGRKLYIVIGDVSGKGVPAGLVMIMARCFFRPLSSGEHTTREIVVELNRLLCKDTRRDMFMTMLLLEYDLDAQRLSYTGAGHEHLLIYRAKLGKVEQLPSGGVPLGMRDDAQHFQLGTIDLAAGDTMLLYTDGITEAVNAAGEMYGLDAAVRLLDHHGRLTPDQLITRVLAELDLFSGGAEQADDITLVALQRG